MKNMIVGTLCLVLLIVMIPIDLVRLGLGKLLYGGEVK